jgi:hypothetical protein
LIAFSDIGDLSSNFVMVNANNGEFPSSEPLLSPDGSYVPRILFLNSSGELLKDVVNEQVCSRGFLIELWMNKVLTEVLGS